MAIITQGLTAQNLMINKSSLGDGDVLFRDVIRPIKVVGSLNYQPQPTTATVDIYGGETEMAESALLATMNFSTIYGDLEDEFIIYNTFPYIKAKISAISSAGANVTVSVNAIEE